MKLLDVFGSRCLNCLFWGLMVLAFTVVVWRADFIFGDEQVFLWTLCRGEPVPWSVFLENGRFYPFTHWDCNVILSLPAHWRTGHVPELLYLVNAVLLLCANLAQIRVQACDSARGSMGRFLPFLVWLNFLVAPSVLLVFCWNIFPECRMLLFIAVFLVGACSAVERDSLAGCAAALLSALVLFGYKETSFIVLGAFSGTCLLGGWRRMGCRGRFLCLAVVVLSVLYVAFYLWYVAGHVSHSYQEGRKSGLVPAVLFYIRQPELALAFALAAVRIPFFLTGRSGRHFLWDAMLFAGVSFVLAYMILQLTSPANYYQVPAYALLSPVFLHWLLAFARRTRFGAVASIGLLLGLLAWNLPHTIRVLGDHLERRRVEMPVIREIAARKDVAHIYYCQNAEGTQADYQFFVLEAFLKHAGCPVRVEKITEFRDELGSDEIEIAPSGAYDTRRKCAVGTLWYSIFMRPEPAPCGREGLVLDAWDDRVEGLYSKDSCWAGRTVKVRLALDPSVRGKPLSVALSAGAITTQKHPENALTLMVDGTRINTERNVWPLREIRFTIPAELTGKPVIDLSVEADHGIRPLDEGLGSDARTLGICFASLKILPVDSL